MSILLVRVVGIVRLVGVVRIVGIVRVIGLVGDERRLPATPVPSSVRT